ncbi:MAG TPA: ABC transporter permease [Pirellulaceae bacterium]|jgi:putative ABC transport system permease protein|nr:ABC transporter permease [Pirellulaceae bacterium]
MSILYYFYIAWTNLRDRTVASVLTALSIALGVTLIVVVLCIQGVFTESMKRGQSLGFNMIAGAKGDKLQLTLNTVFYLSQPVENVPYRYYLQMKPEAVREEEWKNSLEYEAFQLEKLGATAVMDAAGGGGSVAPALLPLAEEAAFETVETFRPWETPSRLEPYIELAVPVFLGDYFKTYRVVGTTPEFFGKMQRYEGEPLPFAEGRNFVHRHEVHGFYEAVVGGIVAREENIKLGDKLPLAHGNPEGRGHDERYTVVGILDLTGTPADRAVFVNAEGFLLMDNHAKPLLPPAAFDEEGQALPEFGSGFLPMNDAAEVPEDPAVARPLPIEQRETTAVLLRTDPFGPEAVRVQINEGQFAQAVYPLLEVTLLMENFVNPFRVILLGLSLLICLVSGMSVIVSIYNSMNDRKRDIAILRALGARRVTVLALILIETTYIALAGGAVGWIAGHAINAAASPIVERRVGVEIGFFDLAPPVKAFGFVEESLQSLDGLISGTGESTPILAFLIERFSVSEDEDFSIYPELALIPGLLILAILTGIIPAIAAYRVDVSRILNA